MGQCTMLREETGARCDAEIPDGVEICDECCVLLAEACDAEAFRMMRRLRKGIEVVFLDGTVVDVPGGEATYSRAVARAIMKRYHDGAATHSQLTVDEAATRKLERAA